MQRDTTGELILRPPFICQLQQDPFICLTACALLWPQRLSRAQRGGPDGQRSLSRSILLDPLTVSQWIIAPLKYWTREWDRGVSSSQLISSARCPTSRGGEPYPSLGEFSYINCNFGFGSFVLDYYAAEAVFEMHISAVVFQFNSSVELELLEKRVLIGYSSRIDNYNPLNRLL